MHIVYVLFEVVCVRTDLLRRDDRSPSANTHASDASTRPAHALGGHFDKLRTWSAQATRSGCCWQGSSRYPTAFCSMTRNAHPARPAGGGLCDQPETGLKPFDGPDHTCLFPVCCVQVRFSHCLVPYDGLVACGSCACPAPPRGRLLCWAAVFDDLSTLFARETFTDGLCQSSSVFVTTFFSTA
jgi:hypothetical protein